MAPGATRVVQAYRDPLVLMDPLDQKDTRGKPSMEHQVGTVCSAKMAFLESREIEVTLDHLVRKDFQATAGL